MAKRLFDILLALWALCLFAPLLLALSLLLRLTQPGPVFYGVTRLGYQGRPFQHWRFRTKFGDPPRTSRTGRLLINSSLDELPAIWNILRGDLSLVGPRPPKPEEVDLADPAWPIIFSVRPGLMGPGLLRYLERYNETPVAERIRPDVYYAQNASLWLDLQILARAVPLWLKMGHLKGKV